MQAILSQKNKKNKKIFVGLVIIQYILIQIEPVINSKEPVIRLKEPFIKLNNQLRNRTILFFSFVEIFLLWQII